MFGGRSDARSPRLLKHPRRPSERAPFDTGINRGRFVCYVRVEYAIKDAFQNGGTNGGRALKKRDLPNRTWPGWAHQQWRMASLCTLHAYAEETNRSLGTSDLLSPFRPMLFG